MSTYTYRTSNKETLAETRVFKQNVFTISGLGSHEEQYAQYLYMYTNFRVRTISVSRIDHTSGIEQYRTLKSSLAVLAHDTGLLP